MIRLLVAIALPVISWVALNLALFLGLFTSQRAELWLEGDSRALMAIVEKLRLDAGFQRANLSMQVAGPDREGCDGTPMLLRLDVGWAHGDASAQRLDAALRSAVEVRPCSSWRFTSASANSTWSLGLFALAALIVVSIYLVGQRLIRDWPAPHKVSKWTWSLAGGAITGLGAVAYQLVVYGIGDHWGLEGSARLIALPDHSTPSAAAIIAMTLLIPMAEEVANRGWMMPLLEQVFGLRAAVALGTAVFAASHMLVVPVDWVAYLGVSFAITLLWVRMRSLLACVIAHGVINGCALVLA